MEYKCNSCGGESKEKKICCGNEMEKKCQMCGNVESQCTCGGIKEKAQAVK